MLYFLQFSVAPKQSKRHSLSGSPGENSFLSLLALYLQVTVTWRNQEVKGSGEPGALAPLWCNASTVVVVPPPSRAAPVASGPRMYAQIPTFWNPSQASKQAGGGRRCSLSQTLNRGTAHASCLLTMDLFHTHPELPVYGFTFFLFLFCQQLSDPHMSGISLRERCTRARGKCVDSLTGW